MAFNAFMPGEDNWMRGQPMPGQAPQMGTPAAPAMTGQPQKPRPIMNAFSKIFEIGAPEAFEAGRQKKLTQNLGNALAGGDYSGAAEMALRGGQLEQGLKLRGEAETRQKAQMDEQRKAEAQAVYRVFSSAPDMTQLNNLAMSDPVGFERMVGISADEYLQVGGQLAQMGMNPEQIRQFIVQGAQAELGMESEPTEYGLDLVQGVDAQGNPVYLQTSKSGGVKPVQGFQPPPAKADAPKYEQITLADGEYEYIPGQPETLRRLGSSAVKQPLVNVNTGSTGPEIGTIPQGFAAVRDPNNPSGFRMEAIPGGPAGTEAQGAAQAKRSLESTFRTLFLNYKDLRSKGAIRDTDAGIMANIGAYAQSSPIGREIGKMGGSQAEAMRETIEALQPAISQAIMSQPGMSARSMDSERELQFFIRSITAPTADVWANYATLHALDTRFGSGQLMNSLLATGEITPDEYTKITRSPQVAAISSAVDQKIGELFTTDQQAQNALTAEEAAELEELRRWKQSRGLQ